MRRMVGKPGENVGEPSVGIDGVELTSLDQPVDRRRPAAALVGTGKDAIAAPDGDAVKRALGGVVAEANPSVVEEAG
jgi:hypothetical protein